jgi:cytochrome c553
MKGYILFTTTALITTIAVAYTNLEYRGQPNNTSCYGECYAEYVALNGTAYEIEQRKQALAAEDEFSSIKSLWAGCAACHGQEGQGMAVFPALKGSSADYIENRLYAYRNKETVGNMSSTMWAQAGQLTDQQITTIGKYIETL